MVIDQDSQSQQSAGQKALSTTRKVTGWYLRYKAIGAFIAGGISIVLSIVFLILGIINGSSFGNLITGPLIFLVIGIIAILVGSWYWKRSKSLVQGKFY